MCCNFFHFQSAKIALFYNLENWLDDELQYLTNFLKQINIIAVLDNSDLRLFLFSQTNEGQAYTSKTGTYKRVKQP